MTSIFKSKDVITKLLLGYETIFRTHMEELS